MEKSAERQRERERERERESVCVCKINYLGSFPKQSVMVSIKSAGNKCNK